MGGKNPKKTENEDSLLVILTEAWIRIWNRIKFSPWYKPVRRMVRDLGIVMLAILIPWIGYKHGSGMAKFWWKHTKQNFVYLEGYTRVSSELAQVRTHRDQLESKLRKQREGLKKAELAVAQAHINVEQAKKAQTAAENSVNDRAKKLAEVSINKANAAVAKAQAEATTARSGLARLQTSSTNQIAELRKDITAKEKTIKDAEEATRIAKAETDKVNAKLAAAVNDKSEAEKKLQAANATAEDLSTKLETAQGEVAEANKQLALARGEADKLVGEKLGLEERLAKTETSPKAEPTPILPAPSVAPVLKVPSSLVKGEREKIERERLKMEIAIVNLRTEAVKLVQKKKKL